MGLKQIIRWLHRFEDGLLVAMLVMMMLLAVSQIIIRNISDSGIVWGDTLVRILVLWAGLLGAMSATRRNEHINIDLVTRYLPIRAKRIALGITLMATGLLCLLTSWHSLTFVRMEKEFGTVAFAAVPAWICQMIIPLAFFIIAVRCLLNSINLVFRNTMPEP